jgi:ubiquinone/menaquinone biosynthesis C-methylase UbiE
MKNPLISLFLQINNVFPRKHHPFHDLKNGMSDMNYTEFEYNHCSQLLDQYKNFIDLSELKGKKILEIGCGWGWKSIYISEKYNAEVIGVDLNLDFLSQAITKSVEKNVQDKVKFIEMDALNMDFWDNEFDIILMSDVLEHIPQTEVLMKEVLRVLKHGWKVLFDFAPYYHYFWHHMWDTIQIPWLHLFTTESFRIALYKESVKDLPDASKRIALRIGKNNKNKEVFTYLNGITRKDFEYIMTECEEKLRLQGCTIKYFMLKNINIIWSIPILREIFIRHIVGVIKK